MRILGSRITFERILILIEQRLCFIRIETVMWKIFRKMLIFIVFVQFHYVYEITDYYVLNVRPKLKKNLILKSNENDSHKYLLYFI